MKVYAFLSALACLPLSACSRKPTTAAAAPAVSPFESVTVSGNVIKAALPTRGARWVVKQAAADDRISQPGDVFELKDGEVLQMIEKHSNYKVTASLAPKPGVQLEYTFDARSFGKGVTKQTLFVDAR